MIATTRRVVSLLWGARAAGRVTLVLATVLLTLSYTDGVRAQPALSSTLALGGERQRETVPSQAVNYHIHGDATVTYDYSSEAGQQKLANCDVDLVPKWRLALDGTLDSVGQNMQGTFEFTGLPKEQWQQWDSTVLQCGSEMHGQTSCNAGCGPNWVQYHYNATTIPYPVGKFQGTYANGHVEILGEAHFAAQFVFEDCFNGITGIGIPCETALGFTPSPVPPEMQGTFPRNAKYFAGSYGVRRITISGDIFITEGGVSIHGNLNLPESAWAECCIVSDPLFLSDKNHVSISGDPAPPPQ